MGIGALFFHVIGGPVFDAMGPSSPFLLVSFLDGGLCTFAVLLGALGMLTYNEPTSEED